jgi:tetratricopeptide (TPR) repeat protein
MRIFFLSIFFLFSVSFSFSQSSPTSKPEIEANLSKLSTDTAKISYLYQAAKKYQVELDSKTDKETLAFIASQAIELTERITSVKYQFMALNLMQQSLITHQRYKKAQEYGQKILALEKKGADNKLKAEIYNAVATSYFYLNDWKNYFNYQFKALRLYESLKQPDNIARVYAALGKASFYTNEPKEGVNYTHKALNYYFSKNNYEKVADVSNDMGTLFMSQDGGTDSAVYYLNQSIEYAKKSKYDNLLTTAQFNLAGIYVERKKYTEALGLVQNAMVIAEKGDNLSSFILYSTGLSYIYTETHKYAEAEKVLLDVLKNTNIVGTPYLKIQIYKALDELYATSGDTKKNLDILKKYNALRDSVFNEEKAEAVAQIKVEYDTEKKEQQIHTLEERVTARNWLTGISLLAGLLALGFVWGYRRAYQLQKKLHIQEQQSFEQQQQNMMLEQAALQAQKELAEQKSLALQQDIEAKQRELTTATMFIQQKNDLLESLSEQIKNLASSEENKTQIQQISKSIRRNMNFDDDWQKIKAHFEGVHPDFFDKLSLTGLTDHELRHCAYIKMKFNQKEIASLLNIDVKSVRISRYRIKKKLGLEQDLDLPEYISSI